MLHLLISAFTIGGIWAVNTKTVGDLKEEVVAVRSDLKDVRGDIRALAQDNGAKTVELAKLSFRVEALTERSRQQDDQIELQRIRMESLREMLARRGIADRH